MQIMSKSISKTNELRTKIKEKFFNPAYWIAQDGNGDICIFDSKPNLGYIFTSEWLTNWDSGVNQYLGKTTKTKYNKTYKQACAQLTVDNWYLDRYGRLIVEDRNTPNLLKEQA